MTVAGLIIGFVLGVVTTLVGVNGVLRWMRGTGRLHSPTTEFVVFCKAPYKTITFAPVEFGECWKLSGQTHATTGGRQ